MAYDLGKLEVKGHVLVEDDLGNVLVDKDNAVHPRNMARVIARALANESNFNIHRIAFGNRGTVTNAAFTVSYKTPNDGYPPDVGTWDSRLYNETYSEIIDDSITPASLLGTDPGSTGSPAGSPAGTRPGGGSNPAGDPASIPHVSGPGVRSNELGLTSEVVITAVLNPGEPSGQGDTDDETNTESSFTFDEIGLYTDGAPAFDSAGSFDVDVGDKTSEDDTGLFANTTYSFNIDVDGAGPTLIDFTTPAAGGSGPGGEILYGDLCEAINTGDTSWNATWSGSNPLDGATIAITNNTLSFPSITGAQTFGLLRVTSDSTGSASSVILSAGTIGADLWASINPPTGGILLNPATGNPGEDAGIQNDPVNPSTERERLLTHIVFSPVLKSANRTLTITYTLTISVARTAV